MSRTFVLLLIEFIFQITLFAQSDKTSVTISMFNWSGEWVLDNEIIDYYNKGLEYRQHKHLYSNEYVKNPVIDEYYAYDNRGNKTLDMSIWPGVRKTTETYQYNSAGFFTRIVGEELRYDSGSNRKWENISTYNEDQKLIVYEEKNWDFDKNRWVNLFRTEYTYSDNYLLADVVQYQWQEDRWTVISECSQKYNSRGQTLEILCQLPSGTMQKTNYQYDEAGNITYYSLAFKYEQDSDLVVYEEHIYQLNTKEQLINELNRYWDPGMQQWHYTQEITYDYDNHGNIIFKDDSIRTYDFQMDSFTNVNTHYQYDLTYDTENRLTEKIEYRDGVPKIKTTYDYKEEIPPDSSFEISLYPNPANDVFNILNLHSGYEKVEITDLSGRMVFQEEGIFAPLIQVNASSWLPGLYIVKVFNLDLGSFTSSRFLKSE